MAQTASLAAVARTVVSLVNNDSSVRASEKKKNVDVYGSR